MAGLDQIKELKRIAKDFGRSKRIPLHVAQNVVAAWVGFPHWAKLAAKVKAGHTFTEQEIISATRIADGDGMYPDSGIIGGHHFQVSESLGDVVVHGRGWKVVVFEAPSETPLVTVTDKRVARNPIGDPSFREIVLRIAQWRAEKVREKLAHAWPRRSLRPDANGLVTHPTSLAKSDIWYCIHCDERTEGREIALNFWHCPHCEATPIDIFPTPFWRSALDETVNG